MWDTFFECFEKFFPDCTLPVYLITNNEMPTYPHATVVTTGDEVSWSHRLRRALEEIPEDTLLVLLEDYFLCEKTSSTKINELFQCFAENDYDYLRVIPIPIQYRWKKNGAYPLDPLALYGVNLQAAIWKRRICKSCFMRMILAHGNLKHGKKRKAICVLTGIALR